MCPAQHHHAFLGPRPHESAALQPLGEQAQSIAIPPQQLQQIAAATPEAENMAGKWVLAQDTLRLRGEVSSETLRQVIELLR